MNNVDDELLQAYIGIQFEGFDQPVMMPVDDPSAINESEKERLTADAWAFAKRSQYATETTNRTFIQDLAESFATSLPLPELLARQVVPKLGEAYLERLQTESDERGDAIVDSAALHLRLEENAGNKTIVIDPPERWEDTAVERVTHIVKPLFTADENPPFWERFTHWMWVNLMTRALEKLEDKLDDATFESISDAEFQKLLYAEMLEREDSTVEFAELTSHYLKAFADIVMEALNPEEEVLWKVEFLLGFRDKAPPDVREEGAIPVRLLFISDLHAVIQRISSAPDELYKLPPRRFEELVADIFAEFGYDVELTPETRDGGFDIAAVRRAETDTRLLIECKRYTPPRKVSRPIVQQLFGVLGDQRATKAILATTATFTKDAHSLFEKHRWQLEPRDQKGILDWMNMVRTKQSRIWTPEE